MICVVEFFLAKGPSFRLRVEWSMWSGLTWRVTGHPKVRFRGTPEQWYYRKSLKMLFLRTDASRRVADGATMDEVPWYPIPLKTQGWGMVYGCSLPEFARGLCQWRVVSSPC